MEDKEVEKGMDQIFSFINILKIASDIEGFQKWLREYHKIESVDHIFVGYKFFLEACVRGFIHSIIYSDSLDLEEDFVFFRARFVGVTLEDIPNTCEKTIFIKNIWNLSRGIREAREWEDTARSIKDFDSLFHAFDEIFRRSIASINGLSKKEALRVGSIFNTYISLNDLERGFPPVYLVSVLPFSAKSGYQDKAYQGYAYALQYLWFNLIGKKRFEQSSLRYLHRAQEISFDKLQNPNGRIKLPKKPKPNKIGLYALDTFFGRIGDEIVRPLEKQLNISLGFEPLLVFVGKFEKGFISEFLKSEGLKELEYLKSTSNEKLIKKKLGYLFLWYDVNVLDAEDAIFNGVPAFVSTLIGSVELSRTFQSEAKVLVLRFKHPEWDSKYRYSYGILIPSFGSTGITDYSGWLVFFDCATDFSGFGGSLHEDAETFIERYLKREEIEVKEEVVDIEIFKRYLAEKSVSSVFDEIKYVIPPEELTEPSSSEIKKQLEYLVKGRYTKLNLSEIKKEMDDFMGNVRGKFFEYLFYNWLTETYPATYKKVECDTTIGNQQIDVYAETENEIHLFECKVNLHSGSDRRSGIKAAIKQIKEKIKASESKNGNDRIVPHLVVFSDVPDKYKKEIESAGIQIKDGFRHEIERWRKLNHSSKKAILDILENQTSPWAKD